MVLRILSITFFAYESRVDNSKRGGDICPAPGQFVPLEFLGGQRICRQTRLAIYNPI